MIYFLKDTVTQAIKIGYSKKPRQRVADLQTGNPSKLILLGTVTGTEADEGEYHVRFAQLRLEGEWFKGEIIEEVLTIISQHKERRLETRRINMTQTTPSVVVDTAPGNENSTRDSASGLNGICRIPGLRLKSISMKLTERPLETEDQFNERLKEREETLKKRGSQVGLMSVERRNDIVCGFELKYLLEFETDVINDDEAKKYDLHKLRGALLATQGQTGLWHTFYDKDNAMIPFSPPSANCHLVGGSDAITGCRGDAFRVLVTFEKVLDPNYQRGPRIKDEFIGDNYPGEHPLKKAAKLAISIRS
jgi:hypothetical protein